MTDSQQKSHNKSQLFQRLECLKSAMQWTWDQMAVALGVDKSFFFHIKADRKAFSANTMERFMQLERDAGLRQRVTVRSYDSPSTLNDRRISMSAMRAELAAMEEAHADLGKRMLYLRGLMDIYIQQNPHEPT